MKRKFAMIAAFVVAISGAIATKASPTTSYKTVNCTHSATCGVAGINCGYEASKKKLLIELTTPK